MTRYEKERNNLSFLPTSSSLQTLVHRDSKASRQTFLVRTLDDFRRDPNRHSTPKGALGADGKVFNPKNAAQNTADSPLARRLKSRHLQMIAIGGSIGTGLFVGSGSALAYGGPGSLLIAFSLIGSMLYCTVQALGEMAVLFPVAGSFAAYSTRFLDPAWGFAMGWNYALNWLVTLPLEIVGATLTIEYWNHGIISNDAWVTLFVVLIISINLFGVKGYGEAEFVFSLIKVIAIVGFIILGIIMNVGGGPDSGYIGGRYWNDPGAFNYGFKGLCSVFVTAAFSFAGTELVGLAAAETANPRKSLPKAVKQVFWRICLFYVVSLTIVGLLVPYTNPRLLNGTSSADASASPFVISIENAGINILPSIMNVIIMISVLSVGNSCIYGSSRVLAALAEQGQAPQILAYIDRKGRPLVAIGFASAFGFIAYIAGSGRFGDAFYWMLAISGLSSILTWGSICLAHIRFRRAWKLQGHSLDELAFRSQPGVIGSWIGFIFNVLVLAAQFWTGFAPIEFGLLSTHARIKNFFRAYLTVPIIICCYIPYKLYYRTKIVRARDMDVKTGIRQLNIVELIADERAERERWPRWKKIYNVFC
ncbi:MAG: glyceraldehyde-3-phosphate dehydrogenase 1 [Pycnora praestabilis]|nr:MAG: glyceraldehyde-3-phosphate dehydrogenase 1 [Pycnora praestabilis]